MPNFRNLIRVKRLQEEGKAAYLAGVGVDGYPASYAGSSDQYQWQVGWVTEKEAHG